MKNPIYSKNDLVSYEGFQGKVLRWGFESFYRVVSCQSFSHLSGKGVQNWQKSVADRLIDFFLH